MVVSGPRCPLPPPLHPVLPLEIGKLSERKLIFIVSNVFNILLIFSVFFNRNEVKSFTNILLLSL